jgi:hypothetical protein
MHTPHRRCLVGAGFRAVEQALKVPLQVTLVILRGYAVHTNCTVLAGALIGFL